MAPVWLDFVCAAWYYEIPSPLDLFLSFSQHAAKRYSVAGPFAWAGDRCHPNSKGKVPLAAVEP